MPSQRRYAMLAAIEEFTRADRMQETIWWITKDGDDDGFEMSERHYSKRNNRRKQRQFVGPGECIVLRSYEGDALFVWRKFKDDCIDERTGKPQEGINCAIFRNENPKAYLSSELVRSSDAVADIAWPGERHYTYVDPKKVRSKNPGCCFIKAGWRRTGQITSRGLLVLERLPAQTTGFAGSDGADEK